jgi:fatty acid desaturase
MKNKISWYKTPISKEELKELTKRSDLRGLLQAGSFLLIFLGTLSLSVYFFLLKLWIPMVITAYVHCCFHNFVGMEAAVHELSHRTPFKSKGLNEVFYRLFCFLTWNNYLHFRISHFNHHLYTVHRGLDKEVIITPDPFNAVDYISWLTFDFKKFKMFMVPTFAHFFGNADVDFFHWDPLLPKDDPRRKKICNWARFMVIGHLILLGVFIYFGLWILVVLVPFGYFFATFPAHGTGISQHSGLHSSVPDWRVCCHTIHYRPLMAFLYWRMNYHIEHHSYAAVPFFNLKKLHKAMAYNIPDPPKGYIAGLKRVFSIHKRQRTEPDYRFMPEFPETADPPKMAAEAS